MLDIWQGFECASVIFGYMFSYKHTAYNHIQVQICGNIKHTRSILPCRSLLFHDWHKKISVKFTKYLERFFRKQLERFKTAELFSLFIPRENVRFSDVSRGLNREQRALMCYKVGITFFPKTKHWLYCTSPLNLELPR